MLRQASDSLTMDDFNVETKACDVQSKIIMTNFPTTKPDLLITKQT